MRTALRRRAAQPRGVAFCDSCGQVCTPACRSQARLEQVRTQVAWQLPLPR
jgi:hypothetical protein